MTTCSVPGACWPHLLHPDCIPTLHFLVDGPCTEAPLNDNTARAPEMSHTDTMMIEPVILKHSIVERGSVVVFAGSHTADGRGCTPVFRIEPLSLYSTLLIDFVKQANLQIRKKVPIFASFY